MAISDRTRKVLWALVGNACARCDASLVRAPEAGRDRHAIVGRECHIIARAPAGPRGQAGPRTDLDGHENLLLLCANCHAIVDAQPEHYPPDELRGIKRAHERRVSERRAPESLDIRLRGREKPMRLELVRSGDALLSVVGPAHSFAYKHPDTLSSEQRELLGDFLESCRDWGDIYGDIGPKGHLDAGQHLQDQLEALCAEGLAVYAGSRRLTLTGAGPESPWREAVVAVLHDQDARNSSGSPDRAT